MPLELLNTLPWAKGAQHDHVDRPRCLDKTCAAVLKEIKDWIERNDEQQLYWLNGVAGTGKTTIALTIANVVVKDKSKLSASFFCSRSTTDRADMNIIFPSIALILAHHDTQFRAHLVKAIERNEQIGSALLQDQLKQLIIMPLLKMGSDLGQHQRPILIVFDALDECAAHHAPEKILMALAEQLELVPFLKVFVGTRPTSSTDDFFSRTELDGRQRIFLLHNVARHDVDVDIRKYLFDQLRKVAKHRCVTTQDWPPADLIGNLVEKAEGLFIFASTVCDYIEGDGRLEHQLQEIATRPIHGLDELYRDILQNAKARFSYPKDADEWLRIIGTIILLQDQLSLNDLGPLLKLDPGHV
jgi:hypothetical protein